MGRISRAFWIWGEFSSIDTNYLTDIQNRVQKELGGPEYKIHMTLAGPFEYIDNSSIKHLRSHCRNHSLLNIKLLNYNTY